MGQRTKNKSSGFLVVLFLLVIAIICGVLYNLMKKTDSFFEDMGSETGGETGNGAVSFAVYQGNSDEEMLNKATGVVIYGTETFTVKKDNEEPISAKLRPVALTENYTFLINNKDYGWLEYVWNLDIADDENSLSPYFEIVVNQDESTVTVSGSTVKALEEYAKKENGMESSLSGMPSEDMYCLEITSGNETFSCYCSFRSANVEDLKLSQESIEIRW
ncbi:MAG: hypothetical protein IJD33_00655 [Clostridia bacterium]|nr:hypothetical protein [Clostridia bacterium]